MKWYTHAIFAIIIGADIGFLLGAELTIRFFIITIIASLIIDFAEKAIFNEHKRQLHNIFTIIPCILAYLFFDMTIGAALTAGILSHIILDCITPTGCPLFWPINKKKYDVKWKYSDNKAREKRILATVSLLALLTVLILLPQGPFMSAISAWTGNKNETNSTNSTHLDLRINLNDPTKDMWIYPLPNGSIFIDIVDEGQGYMTNYYYSYPRSYPRYYPIYREPSIPKNTSPQEEEEEEG